MSSPRLNGWARIGPIQRSVLLAAKSYLRLPSDVAAEAAHRKLTQFLAVLAHELRNPLAPIRNAAALISGVPAGQLPALQGVIERQVLHSTHP